MADRTRSPSPPSSAAPAPRRPFHGRRHGRRLRPGLATLLRELLPRLAIVLPPAGSVLDPHGLFAPPVDGGRRPIWLEIGFGGGEHLAWQAHQHPAVGLLGAEMFVNGIAQLLRRLAATGAERVRIFQGDGRALLEVLPEASIDRAFILFPDPWPKARHHKRRLVQGETLDQLARVLRDGAELRLASDDRDYVRWMVERLCAHPAFTWLAERPADWRQPPADWPATRYQSKAEGRGVHPVYLRFARRSRPV